MPESSLYTKLLKIWLKYCHYINKWTTLFHFVQIGILFWFGIVHAIIFTIGCVSHRLKQLNGMIVFGTMVLWLFFGWKHLLVTICCIVLLAKWNKWQKNSPAHVEKCLAMKNIHMMWSSRFGSDSECSDNLDAVKNLLNTTEKLTNELKRCTSD